MDFSKVTALQIPEGNVTKIEDKEGKVLWANVNKLAYGVRWDSVNQATTACERIGNLELHKTLPIQSRFKVCIHKGKEIQYYCNPIDSRFVEESKRSQFTHQGTDLNITACDGLPAGVVSCEEKSVVKCKFVNKDLFSNYRFLYSYVSVRHNINTFNVAISRIVYINTTTGEAYIDDSRDIDYGDYAYTDDDFRYLMYEITDPNETDFTDNCTVELGCSINGYDGEIGVDTGGKFYQWSVDNDGAGNEVWQSLYKCVPYAREIKRHIIGIDRACVLNVAFNDTKWGWIGSLEANTAVNVINYHTNLRGGDNTTTFDKYLGVDSFRCQLGKARTKLYLDTMRSYSQKTDGGQMLYKQIWEAIVWSYVIEYADFNVKKAYNSNLTTEGYHQGGLGSGVIDEKEMIIYSNYQKVVPNDYTLSLGNHTGNKNRISKRFNVHVDANHYWNYYTIDNSIISALNDSYKVLTIMTIINPNTDYNIKASGDVVGGTVRYKISGLTNGQTIVFKREKGNLTITADGTYDVEWGTSNVERKIYFNEFQSNCNIVIEIVNAPAYDVIKNQISWDVPHYRGFNIFWYGDIAIHLDNTLNIPNNKKRIWYYTDDVAKFSNDITDKEHQIEVIGNVPENWLQEIKINDKGDIVPSKIIDNTDYKQSYYSVDRYIKSSAVVGGSIIKGNECNILTIYADYDYNHYKYDGNGFVKVTILDS